MDVSIATSLIATSGAIIVAGASYWFTKKREREAVLRREKLAHYKDFVTCLTGVIAGEYTAEGQRAFARACNALNLVAPQTVLKALQDFQQEIKQSNVHRTIDRHDFLMSALFFEMRKDLGISPSDHQDTFRIGLWASGQGPAS